MPVTLRLVKGSALTYTQGDDNYKQIISSASLSGDNLLLYRYQSTSSVDLSPLKGAITTAAISGAIDTATGSLYYSSSVIGSTISFHQGDGTIESVVIPGSIPSAAVSGAINTATSSLYESSSINGNIISYFQGDGSIDTITLPSSTLPSGLISSSQQIATEISGAFTAPTASFYVSSSVSGSQIAFTKGDGNIDAVDVTVTGDVAFPRVVTPSEVKIVKENTNVYSYSVYNLGTISIESGSAYSIGGGTVYSHGVLRVEHVLENAGTINNRGILELS